MADRLHRSRPSAPDNRPLWLMAGVSLLAHLALLSLGGFASQPAPASAPSPLQISLRPRLAPAAAAPATERVAEDNRQGAGNTAQARQLLSRSAPPKPTAAPAAPEQTAAPLNPIVRSAPAPAKLPATPPAAKVSTGSLLAQVGALSRGGDNAAADNDKESGPNNANPAEAARSYPWARYQADWQLKVERIGNLNYPEEARRRDLHGSVTLDVTIAADGSLRSMRVSRSSGSPILDQAAQHIVELAAPFAPFPPALAKSNSTLRINRKFVFTRDNLLSSH
ncbi:energy transducer TonB [Chromobacterium alticapitis]|uniref:Energy transducer TonB n=1 Tax=Chromobacterium alticapitis TaxID=2073169 RepID=A0A2S5DJQ6_9NEIS|nr:energy transducer TonB [Chromobacterium alticapitis]POZ63259.1 energy transducer TonB [Chromobacterium alticapitis]